MQQGFPTWRYHKTESPRIVRSPEELAALGPEWADTPAKFIAEETLNAEVSPADDHFHDFAAELAEVEKPKRGRKPKGL